MEDTTPNRGRSGRSFEGRPLELERLGPQAPGPSLLVVGGVHGDEPSSVEAVRSLGRWLTDAAPPARVLLLPALNPDGLVRGTKDNARGVDLNRNFPASNFTTAHAPGYFPGRQALSEPETSFLAAVIAAEGVAAAVAVHAPFACVNFDGPAASWAEAVALACGWPVRPSIGYPTPGSFGSWFGVDGQRPVLTLELPPGPFASFAPAADSALRSAVAFWADFAGRRK